MEIVEETISAAWECSLRALLGCRQWVPTERNSRALELRNVVFQILKPLKEPIVSTKYQFNQSFIDLYCKSIKETYPGGSIKSRLFEYGEEKLDQIDLLKRKLTEQSFSRRAVACLWNPSVDILSVHPPCALNLQFLVRNKRLHMTAVLRSNDAWMAAIPDMLAFSQLQKEIADSLSIKMGTYTQLSASYHLYEPDYAIAKKVFMDVIT
jgi:thymidylate synthase